MTRILRLLLIAAVAWPLSHPAAAQEIEVIPGKQAPVLLSQGKSNTNLEIKNPVVFLSEDKNVSTDGVKLDSSIIDHRHNHRNAPSMKAGGQVYDYYSNVVDNKTPMTWLVLDSSGDDMLLLSLYAVDVQPYHHALEALTWENSDLRRWLNTTFLDEAFSPEEQERINVTHVFNGDNPYYGTPGGNDTDDQVFLLSVSEAEYYLNTEELRGTWPTLYAESLGAYCDSSNGNWMRYTQWWLRTPGGYDGYASVMPCGWEVNADGLPADNSYLNVAVRPCIRIKK